MDKATAPESAIGFLIGWFVLEVDPPPSAAARLLRAYAAQVEALRRLRNGGSQTLRVEHVHVNEGGQAIIGNVNSIPGSGR